MNLMLWLLLQKNIPAEQIDLNHQLNGSYFIQQVSSKRFVDAYENSKKDFNLITRQAKKKQTQVWIIKSVGSDEYTIQQASSGRYMDAHEYKA